MNVCTGEGLKRALEGGIAWLERHAEAVNVLNVYPVPDGDTGTNMLLTMRAALEEVSRRSSNHSAVAVAQAVSYGALMGARGNSGVILSQLFRGLARVLNNDSFTAKELAAAMREGAATAYKGVIKPVEGTILTVAREAAEAAVAAAEEDDDILYVLERVVMEAKRSVARTPSLLSVLREAGVVDAGGQGLFIILEGALRFLKGEAVELAPEVSAVARLEVFAEQEYGYDTQFIIKGENLNVEEIREAMSKMGDSVLVVGDPHTVKVHLHTEEPGTPLNYAARLGSLTDIVIENMQEQYREFARGAGVAVVARMQPPLIAEEVGKIATVVVAPGAGLARVFESLGASAIVPGGQTMNPSIQELLEAVESLKVDKVIILPNNPNIIPVAQQAKELSRKEVAVVPTKTLPQGISALLALNYQEDLEANVEIMSRAAQTVQTAEITRATRSVWIEDVRVEEGEVIGLLDGKLTASGRTLEEVVRKMLRQMGAEECEVITLYYGEAVDEAEAEMLADEIRAAYPDQEVELVEGGQPHYHYIISAE